MKTAILLVSLFLATSLSVGAKTVKYPEKDPAFSITLPDDWTTKAKPDGNLECIAGDGSKFSFIVQAQDSKTDDALKNDMGTLAKAMGEGAEMKDLKISDVIEMAMPKVKLFAVNGTGTTSGLDMILTVVGFAPKKGTYFAVLAVETKEVDRAHDKVMGEIMSSITPVSDAK